MPTQPPYPRQATIVTVEKGTPGQTVTGINFVLITLNRIR